MRRKREAGKPVVGQVVPDFVSDLGLAVTCNKTLTAMTMARTVLTPLGALGSPG